MINLCFIGFSRLPFEHTHTHTHTHTTLLRLASDHGACVGRVLNLGTPRNSREPPSLPTCLSYLNMLCCVIYTRSRFVLDTPPRAFRIRRIVWYEYSNNYLSIVYLKWRKNLIYCVTHTHYGPDSSAELPMTSLATCSP